MKKKTRNGNGDSIRRKGNGNSNRNGKRMNGKIAAECSGDMTHKLRMKLEKSLFYDPRASVSTTLDLYASNMNSVIPFRVPVEADVFASPILAAVSYALQRGWSIGSNRPSDPYLAASYMIQLLVACAKNETPEMMSIPVWLHYLCQAVTERKVRARTGQMDYSFELITDWLNPFDISVGYNNFATYTLQNKGTSTVNGLFSTSVTPVAYSDVLGAEAAQSLWLYLASVHPNSPMHKTISISETNKISRDASAYAIVISAPGGGFANIGAWFKRLQLEVPVRHPLFSAFAGDTARVFGDNSRAPNFIRNFVGDGFLLGGMLAYKLMPHQIALKNWPKFHFVDFNELLDVLAQAMTLAIGFRLGENDTQESIARDPSYYVNEIQCPLTIQEVGLLLRATVMSAFDDSQLLGQAIFPRTGTRGDNEFVSFVCGTNTAPQSGATMMRIPMLLKQNVLALRERVINASRAGSANPAIWLPILGQYLDDRLSPGDYQNELEPEVAVDVFTTVPGEIPISYIDGSTSTGDLVWINDPAPLTRLAEIWNAWTVRMGNYFWGFDTIGADPGVDPLFSGCMTLHWADAPGPQKSDKVSKSVVKHKDPLAGRWDKIKQNPSAVYVNRRALAVSSYVPPFKNAWEGVQQMFVFPVNKVLPVRPSDPTTFTGYQRIAAFQNEEFQIPLGSGESNFVSQADRHIVFATQMVKQIWADKDTTQKVIEELERQGDAGILSSLAASLAGKVIPGIGPIASAVASVLPF